jgi:hypothetical protein
MHLPAGVIALIGLAVVGSSVYSLSEAYRGLGIRDVNWVLMRKEEGPGQYYWIITRTIIFLLAGGAILALGVFKIATGN